MFAKTLSKSIFLLVSLVIVTCVIYPGILWVIGQTLFPFQANGSIVYNDKGQVIGSMLIAQPFTKDEYFQPRPSAASYDASASTSSALAPSNYALRDRVSRTLGPIVKYQNGQPVAPDVEKWVQQDTYQQKNHIVAQWATAHNTLATAWVNADPTHAQFVDSWSKQHPDVVKQFIKNNPTITQPKAADLAVVFFQHFSEEHPGKFPSSASQTVNGKTVTVIQPTDSGTDVQSIFFDMWRQEHPDVVLQDVPGDYVTTSASGLDPHISLQNAEFQLDRVAAKWATNLHRDPAAVRSEIENLIQEKSSAPIGGLVGEKFVNVLELNLNLRKMYGEPK